MQLGSEATSGRRARVRCGIAACWLALVAVACTGTEAQPSGGNAAKATGPTRTSAGLTGTTVVDVATTEAPVPPESTTTTVPPLPSVPVDDLGPLTEANPAVTGGNPGRDVGISVRLGDGRYLWVFGDTMLDGYVLSNSAGTSSAGSTAIHDWADRAGHLVPFIAYTAEEEAYNRAHAGDGSRWVLWPNAMIAVNGGTKVIVFYERSITNLRPGGGSSTGPTGKPTIGVAEWDVTPAGANQPIQARRVNDKTFTGANLNAAFLDASGATLWLMSCVLNGRCLAAKVAVADAEDGTKWTWWTGRGHSPDVRAGIPMAFPDPESADAGRTYPDGTPFAAAPFAGGNIAWDRSRGLYLMAFTSWPGFATYGYLRASRSPTGPWGPPLRFALPGCEVASCYAVSVHPDLSRGSRAVGISYHRPPFTYAATVDTTQLVPG